MKNFIARGNLLIEDLLAVGKFRVNGLPEKRKKRQATHIAPLQPRILAAFRPWGDSAGAGRVRPAGREDKQIQDK